LKVWVYTIDDPALANELLDRGVDGIITNNTSLIRKTIALRRHKAR
jgi:glycerophosphoryl diester phosphodiesterase